MTQQEHNGAHRITDAAGSPCRVLLLGEDNPQSADRYALYNSPPGCAGARLEGILGITVARRYLTIWRTNLCNPRWSIAAARLRANVVLDPAAPWSVVVALGAKVRDAIGYNGGFFTGAIATKRSWRAWEADTAPGAGELLVVSLPHPSGRNLVWNDPASTARARAIMLKAAPELYAP